LLHAALKSQVEAGARSDEVQQRIEALRQEIRAANRRTTQVLAGGVLFICATLLTALVALPGALGVPWAGWALFIIGAGLITAGLLRP
jgi:ubiquinone biosynthesis protein